MEAWEILNTYLIYNKACDGNNVSGIQGAQTV